MERPMITFSSNAAVFTSVNWDVDWREQSTGMTVAGQKNIAVGLLPRWIGTLGVFAAHEMIGVLRAHRLAARGQTGLYRITMVDPAVFNQSQVLTFSDGTKFLDGKGFEPEYAVRTDVGASRGDVQIIVNMATANAPIAQGQILSYGDWPFAVEQIEGNVLTIAPPLRSDIPAGDLIRLNGRGIFEITSPMSGALGYDNNLAGTGTFQFQEWLR